MCVRVELILGSLLVTHFFILALGAVAVSKVSAIKFAGTQFAFVWSTINRQLDHDN